MTRITRSASIHLAHVAMHDPLHAEKKVKRKRSDSLGSSYDRSPILASPSVETIDRRSHRDVLKICPPSTPFSPATSCSMLSSIDSASDAARVREGEDQPVKASHGIHANSSSMTSVDDRSSPQSAKTVPPYSRGGSDIGKKSHPDAKYEPRTDGNQETEQYGRGSDQEHDQEHSLGASDDSFERASMGSKQGVSECASRARVALFTTAPQRKSCDRCFRMKTKCSRAAPGASTDKPCEGCVRRGFGHDCVTSRPDFPHPKITMAKRVRREYAAPTVGAPDNGSGMDMAMSARIRAVQWSRQHTSQHTPSRSDRLINATQEEQMHGSAERVSLPRTHREDQEQSHRSSSTHAPRHAPLDRVSCDYVRRDLAPEGQRMALLPPLSSARHSKIGSYHDKRCDMPGGVRHSFDEPELRFTSRRYQNLTPSPPMRTSPNNALPSTDTRTIAMRNVDELRRNLYENGGRGEEALGGVCDKVRSMRTEDLVEISHLITRELGRRSGRMEARYIDEPPNARHRQH